MKGNLLQLIIGALLGAALTYFTFDNNRNSVDSSAKINRTIPKHKTNLIPGAKASSVKNVQTKSQTIPPEMPAELIALIKKDGGNPEDYAPSSITQSEKKPTKEGPAVSRSEVQQILDQIADKDLAMAKDMLGVIGKDSADKIFNREQRDNDWATNYEEKITYDYYDKPPLEGRGNLDGVECRSQHCKIRFSIAGEPSKIAQQLIFAFPKTVMTRKSDDSTDENPSYEIFIDRDRPDISLLVDNKEKEGDANNKKSGG